MTAKDQVNKYVDKYHDNKETVLLTKFECELLMESYHQSRINSISDEMIYTAINNRVKDSKEKSVGLFIGGWQEGVKWFKQKLLNK